MEGKICSNDKEICVRFGLSNIKRYAERHGVELEVKSSINEGNEFTIRIPRYQKEG
jgi:signal transduction histidine kinase